ncbi:glycosyl hydrolase family 18 protein [Halalkalibacter nanhaiisediminis]|uniref:Spore germination protein YaaH n=1 Tax=Halalkalibacter nanhaiisediminis TaxID=688079 RepID=A0A562QN88_9BACI|nr:glycoside hydrolase family 18 protein [Halalkalibacter nanhaiisediminis]TWI58133.1 spore germination protein YaaH [Halalkalibacter nanhaiisediminis]
MFIYTVKQGDSLFSISLKYNVLLDTIRLTNGLVQTNIVPGQSLLIPLYTYIVQPGDSFWMIARMACVSVDQLQTANPSINPHFLQLGMVLIIPDISNHLASTLGYYIIRSPELDQALINDFAPYATYFSFFDYHFDYNGDLNELNDLRAIEAAWNRRVIPLATITNLTEEGFSPDLVRQMLNNPAIRQRLIENIVTLVSTKGYGGINIDIEEVAAEDRDLFSGFLQQLSDRLRPAGFLLTIAVPPKESDDIPWFEGYDYGAIGSVVDFTFIMAYNWHYAGSGPGPIASIMRVRNTIEYAISKMPSQKIILGVPLFGFDWTLPFQTGSRARALSNQNAVHLAMQYQVPIQYSEIDESPFFEYVDEKGRLHAVWFEDSRSMCKKMQLIHEFRLEGIGAWHLSLGFPQGVWLLTKFFTIEKA